ncbi:MAG: toxin-antitoxin system YwqK family antitoxin [Thermonemataceae bacterium]
MVHRRFIPLALIFLWLNYTASLAQDEWTYTTWKEVEQTKFGKEVLYKSKEGKLLQGNYKIAESTGAYSKATFINGKPSGEWRRYDATGKIESTSRFKDGLRDGKSETFYQNGKLQQEAYWDSGKKTGTWKSYKEDGTVWSEEHYKNDLKDRKWTKKIHYAQTGKNTVTMEFYKMGERVGTWEEKDEEGRIVKSKKFTSDKDYVEKEFYPNGALASLEAYQNNRLHGTSKGYNTLGQLQFEAVYEEGYILSKKTFHGNGTLASLAHYKHQALDGKQEFYAENGDLISYKVYEEGYLMAEKRFHPNGKLEELIPYAYHKKHGKATQFNEKGIKIREAFYEEGVASGTWVYYTDDGDKASTQAYKDGFKEGIYVSYNEAKGKRLEGLYEKGRRTGTWKYYKRNGKLEKEIVYEDDVVVSEKKYY